MAETEAGEGRNKQAAVLPVAGRRNVLVTSALLYVDNVPHLGNLVGCVLSADAYARYCRPRRRVRHGHREVYRWFDHFVAAADGDLPGHIPEVALSERTIQQLYCSSCQRFLAGRLVVGSCPTEGCGYDQCEKCGELLNSIGLRFEPNDCYNKIGVLRLVMFPSTLLGTGENWTLLKTISVTEYLNYESGKFSKANGIDVFGNDAKDTNIPPEVWRYYLLANRPEASDTQFTWTDLHAKLNKLVNKFGNFINRVLSFIAKPEGTGYGSIIPPATNAESHPQSQAISETVGKLVDQYIDAMDKVKLKQGLKIAIAICSEGNGSQFWKLYKQDPPGCATVMKTSVGLVYLLACLLEPFMPSSSKQVLQQLNLCLEEHLSFYDEKGERDKAKRPWDLIPSGHKIGKLAPLFKGLDDSTVKGFKEKLAVS
ncbi:putative methionine--tRNA ligase [Dichanthelium oligosanthes]|uniref:Putative methionine--tRNA ligase n=1 Tax=Dichanthelium oligosanthes TaxID=888268 RepID=A0A1E5UJ84_9POAL|nr:putative methionine--tRNA ligase [Dichanthelium oligosanthes]